jgi:serine/threonine protein kinase
MNPASWLETQELIAEALQRPPSEREQFVRERCADPVLRERIATLLDATRTSDAAPTFPVGLQDASDLSPGTAVGPYIILRRLGRGGMGEVFLGRDPRLDRQVALKCLLSSHAGGPDLRDRVIREARAAARITHARVAGVYDVVEHDGRMFIVMEYVEGESLSAVLRRGPIPIDRVVEMGRQLAEALAAAHGGAVIHRDLKPSNIQVTPDGSVKILDFGIAMAFATVASATTTTTDAPRPSEPRGPQPGTPAYMSPEQLLGSTVDERSDVFSLAVVLFEMATGRRPILSVDALEMLASMQRLPRADSIDRRVPGPLADVIQKGLAVDPAERFQSAVELRAALDAVRDELFPSASQQGIARRGRPSRGSRIAWGAAVLAGVPIGLWFLGRVMSAAFNITLGRTGGFASEPAPAHLVWGARSIVAPSVYAVLAVASVWTIRFAVRVLLLVRPASRASERLRQSWQRVAATLALDDPLVLAQALAALGIPSLALVVWRFHALIQGWGTMISTTTTPEVLWRLGPANSDEKVLYRAVLTVLLLAFTAGLVRISSGRPRRRWSSTTTPAVT